MFSVLELPPYEPIVSKFWKTLVSINAHIASEFQSHKFGRFFSLSKKLLWINRNETSLPSAAVDLRVLPSHFRPNPIQQARYPLPMKHVLSPNHRQLERTQKVRGTPVSWAYPNRRTLTSPVFESGTQESRTLTLFHTYTLWSVHTAIWTPPPPPSFTVEHFFSCRALITLSNCSLTRHFNLNP